jgi:hypothetical protein
MKADTIQFWILVIAGLGMLSGFSGWVSSHFASAESLSALSRRVDLEVQERRELKAEIDSLYLRFIPPSDRIPLKHPGYSGD